MSASFKDRLVSLRNEKGLTQEEFAKEIGMSKSAVSMYENGRRTPSFDIEEKIADYFNVDLEYLRGRSDFKDRAWINYKREEILKEALESMITNNLSYELQVSTGDYIIFDKDKNQIAYLSENDIIDIFQKNNSISEKDFDSTVLTAARNRKFFDKYNKLDAKKRKFIEQLIDSYLDDIEDD